MTKSFQLPCKSKEKGLSHDTYALTVAYDTRELNPYHRFVDVKLANTTLTRRGII